MVMKFMNRKILGMVLLASALLFVQLPVFAKKKVKKIVLDAGHGGKDPGCHGLYSFEKDITLSVTKKVGAMLDKEYKKDVSVAYTRTYDVLPPDNTITVGQSLIYRTDYANQEKGDLFISIHVNSTPRKNSPKKGTLVLVCGPTRVDEKEGSIGENVPNIGDKEELLDQNDPATAIIIAQYSQAFLNKSISLGEKINNQFVNQGRETEGVRQQSLQVLASTAMPGVLVEIGYLNNSEEEAYLNSEEGQNAVATAIFNGIKLYKEEIEKDPIEVKIEN
jgi:N-acetylmuramoyl-L-alanine amidase